MDYLTETELCKGKKTKLPPQNKHTKQFFQLGRE